MQGGLASGSGQDEKLGQESDCTKVHEEARVASSGKGFPMAGSIQPGMRLCGRDSHSEHLRGAPRIQEVVRKHGARLSSSPLLPPACPGQAVPQPVCPPAQLLQGLPPDSGDTHLVSICRGSGSQRPMRDSCILRETALPKDRHPQLLVPRARVTPQRPDPLPGEPWEKLGWPWKAEEWLEARVPRNSHASLAKWVLGTNSGKAEIPSTNPTLACTPPTMGNSLSPEAEIGLPRRTLG